MRCALVAVTAGLPAWALHADVQFVEVAAERGLVHVQHEVDPASPMALTVRYGTGVAIGDYDRDGDPDIYACDSVGWPNRLFRNDGGTFTDVTVEAGVGDTGFGAVPLFADLDGDGWRDLLVVNHVDPSEPAATPTRIYRNVSGSFTDLGHCGIDLVDPTIGGVATGDIDRDGDLDIIVVGWVGNSLALYRNDGDFQFTDVTSALMPETNGAFFWTPTFLDADLDGWADLFCAVDFGPDVFWRNDTGVFRDESIERGVTHGGNDMGVAVGDFDADGDLDLYATNITPGDECPSSGCDVLYVNDGTGRFTFGEVPGLGDTGWGWGTAWIDANFDGRLDLVAVNGWSQEEWHGRPMLFMQDAAGAFEDRAEAAGMTEPGNTRALATLDFDGDGDIDLLTTDVLGPLRLWENRTTDQGNALHVEVETSDGNSDGIGARVTVEIADRRQVFEIPGGGSFLAGPEPRLSIGLGSAESVDRLTVLAPTGGIARRCDVASGSIIVEVPVCAGDVDRNGLTDFADLVAVLAAWGPCAGCCEADRTLDDVVDDRDAIVVLEAYGCVSR